MAAPPTVSAIVVLTGDEDVGLRLGRSFRLAALGPLRYVLMNAETLGQCIRKYGRHERLIADPYRRPVRSCNRTGRYRRGS